MSLQSVALCSDLADDVHDVIRGGGDVHTRPACQRLGPVVSFDDEVGEDQWAPVGNGHARLCPRTAVLARLDHDGRDAIAGHGRVAHQQGVHLRWGVRPVLREQQALLGDDPCRSRFAAGYVLLIPVPITATVRPPASRAAW